MFLNAFILLYKSKMEENKEEILKNVGEMVKLRTNKNPWMISTIFLGAIVLVLMIIYFLQGGITGNVIKGDDAGSQLVEYLNAKTGGGVEYVSSEDLGNIYMVTVAYQGDEIPVYITKDGKYFLQGAVPLSETATDTTATQTQTQPQNIPKSDKPKVELFIMTYCPYGTQAEKGIIPAIEALGNKIDAEIRFVHYFMHGDDEEQETYRQLCIREKYSDKYLDYLKCFLEDGNATRCLNLMKLNVDSCMTSEGKTYYATDSELSQGYGVQGSPTLIINGQEVSSARDSASYLKTICSAFNTAPSECSKTLSSTSPSSGFGYSATAGSSATAAQCG